MGFFHRSKPRKLRGVFNREWTRMDANWGWGGRDDKTMRDKIMGPEE